MKGLIMVFLAIFLGGCVTAVEKSDDSFLSLQKEGVKAVLLKTEEAWNRKDTETFLSCFAVDAQIMVGRQQKMVNKSAYKEMFPAAFNEAGKVKYRTLYIEILDANNAKVQGVAYISANGGDLIWLTKKLHLVKNPKGEWLINESNFEIYFRGDVDPRDKFRPRAKGEIIP